MDIIPVMLLFLTPFGVNVDKHTLKPYMAPVNHNVINKSIWLNIVHTLIGFFCHKSAGKNNTTPMESMGSDACIIVGYHNNVSLLI